MFLWNLIGNMGKTESKYLDTLSSDDDSDYDDAVEHPVDEARDSFHRTEPANALDSVPRSSESLPPAERQLNLDRLPEIENQLDEDEIVALVYLVIEENHFALQELRLRLQDSSRRILLEWARREEKLRNSWAKKLIEALCIIQNYKILKLLGFNKQSCIEHYIPHQPNTVLHLNKMRKICYILCEKMNNQKTNRFLEKMKKDAIEKGVSFPEHNYSYLEMFFLEMEIVQYISPTNLDRIKRIFKVMDEDELYNMIDSYDVLSENNEHISRQNKALVKDNKPSLNPDYQPVRIFPSFSSGASSIQTLNDKPSTSLDNNQRVKKNFTYDQQFVSSSIQSTKIGKYLIDPENPGVVLIINQQDFYTEYEEKYKNLLPPDTSDKLEQRTGTEKDKEYLRDTFKKFGFKVIIEENLTHLEMVSKIKEVLTNITKESSLFICIMSHGDKGIVYGSNSCRVRVSQIQRLMCKTNKANLQGKPKILILQSCQGQQCQKINNSSSDEDDSSDNNNSDFAIDNPTSQPRQSLPKTADMFTFWATVPGYASVRNKKKGTWFIQALCKLMENLGNKVHFADICTSVINEVTEKKWNTPDGDINVTTPMIVNTLRHSFYLPPMKN